LESLFSGNNSSQPMNLFIHFVTKNEHKEW
jgi:hypothetical protein